jgi:acetyltransferase-like isoleucine patch superfamily enzyme
MAYLSVNFGSTPADKLQPLGIKLPTLSGPCRLRADSRFEPPCAVQARIDAPTFLDIGAFCSVSGGQINNVRIGRYAAVAPDVRMGAHEHPTNWLTCSRVAYFPVVHDWDKFCKADAAKDLQQHTHPFPNSCPVTTLGADVWIGQGAFIKSGVTIGAGAVVGARSAVIRDVPPYAIVAGIPATVKKYRFDERTIERLLALQWWRFSLYDCFDVPFERIEEALDRIEERVAQGTLTEYRPEPVTAETLQALFATA